MFIQRERERGMETESGGERQRVIERNQIKFSCQKNLTPLSNQTNA